MSQYLVTCLGGGSNARSSSSDVLVGEDMMDDGPGKGSCEPGGRWAEEELTEMKGE